MSYDEMLPTCEHLDGSGEACGHPARRLRLQNMCGGIIYRSLCRKHSDWAVGQEDDPTLADINAVVTGLERQMEGR